jgi:hypothetical protein
VYARLCLLSTTQSFVNVLKLFNEKVLKPKPAAAPSNPTAAIAAGVPTAMRKPAPAAGAAAASTTAPSASGSAAGAEGRPSVSFASATTTAPAAASVAGAESAGTKGPVSAPSGGGGPRKFPIIVVPSALTSTITMINIQDFLLGGQYFTVEQKRNAGAHKERELLMLRQFPNKSQLMYKIIDDPSRLSPDEWERVVAVFATGQEWQFKNWQYSSPVSLFQHVLGVHVCIDSAAVNANILSWNCKVLKVNLSASVSV